MIALRFGKNFEAVFGEGLHEKHEARSGFVTYNWLQNGRKSRKTVTELTVRNSVSSELHLEDSARTSQ